MDGTMTVAEAAARVGKHKSTINRKIEAGAIKATMDNERKYRVDIESLFAVYPPIDDTDKRPDNNSQEPDINGALILEIERERTQAIADKNTADAIAQARQERIEEQREVMVEQQAVIDDQGQRLSRLETTVNNAINHARRLHAENARLAARKWWQLNW